MEEKLLRYTLRVDRLLFKKFRYIAESEGRSANKEIEQYLKKRIAEYEKENGRIEIDKEWDGVAKTESDIGWDFGEKYAY